MIPILDLKPQHNELKEEIQSAIARVIESSAFIMGPDVRLFEQEVAQYLGVKHAIGVNSGTDALVIGLKALGIAPGDEVITTPFSFFATAESIGNVGAKPIFVDIEPDSYNINPHLIEAKISEKTKAIMPVHLYGRPAAMNQIMEIAKAHNLKVIEDCAQSFGSSCENINTSSEQVGCECKLTGAIGDVGAFSFFPSKNLGAFGDGGLITTNDDQVAELAKSLRTHGASKKYHNERLGYNSRLDTIQAAVLRVKLPHINRWNEGRRRVAQTYNKFLSAVPSVITPECLPGHVFHQYTIRVPARHRDAIYQKLRERGIGCMIYYPVPQDRLPVYRGEYVSNPESESMSKGVISLPIWPDLDDKTIEKIANSFW
ncbi:MAG: DegT/DnrJ/EryC1/StrS family aminotransferase, partial [Cyanobacteria bacterium P01_F01_bin.3]